MKSITILVIGIACTIHAHAQGVFTNDVNSALQKVIQDYPNQFVNLKGAQLAGNLQAVQYHSTVVVPGSVKCVLTKSGRKDNYSWKCIMLESEKFHDGKEKFNELYSQIKNTIVKMQGEKPFILNGKYEAPSDDRKFTSIVFQLLPSSGPMEKLKVELTLHHTINDWKVTLAVYDDERKNDELPDLTDRY